MQERSSPLKKQFPPDRKSEGKESKLKKHAVRERFKGKKAAKSVHTREFVTEKKQKVLMTP